MMRMIFSWFAFLIVFAVSVIPFVLFRLAVERGDIDPLSPTATGVFAAASGAIGWALASLAANYVKERREVGIELPKGRLRRAHVTQLLFLGVALALTSIALQYYPVYRDFAGRSLSNDLRALFESGWLVLLGGSIALVCAYKLVRGVGDEDKNA